MLSNRTYLEKGESPKIIIIMVKESKRIKNKRNGRREELLIITKVFTFKRT